MLSAVLRPRRDYSIRLDLTRLDASDVERCVRAAATASKKRKTTAVSVTTASAAIVEPEVTQQRHAHVPVRQRVQNMFADALGTRPARSSIAEPARLAMAAAEIETALFAAASRADLANLVESIASSPTSPASSSSSSSSSVPPSAKEIGESYRLRARELLSHVRAPDGDALRVALLSGAMPASEFVVAAAARLAAYNPTHRMTLAAIERARALRFERPPSAIRERAPKGAHVCKMCANDEVEVEYDTGTHTELTKAETWGSKDAEKNASYSFVYCLQCGTQWRI